MEPPADVKDNQDRDLVAQFKRNQLAPIFHSFVILNFFSRIRTLQLSIAGFDMLNGFEKFKNFIRRLLTSYC